MYENFPDYLEWIPFPLSRDCGGHRRPDKHHSTDKVYLTSVEFSGSENSSIWKLVIENCFLDGVGYTLSPAIY